MEFFDVCEKWRDDTLFRVYPCKNNTNNKMEVKTMNKNKAPDEIKGVYMVEIIGNETIITPVGFEDAVYFYKKNPRGSKTYRCHPDDKFDAGWALNDYLKNKDRIQIGDKVTVVDYGYCYPSVREWLVKFANVQRDAGNTELADNILLNWGRGNLANGGNYRVIDLSVCQNNKYVLIGEERENGMFFIVGREGLKKVQ